MLYTIFKNDVRIKEDLNKNQALTYLQNVAKKPFTCISAQFSTKVNDARGDYYLCVAKMENPSITKINGEIIEIDFKKEKRKEIK